MNQPKQIGDILTFTTPEPSESGHRHLCGRVTGRDWAFDRLVAYTVETLAGRRYHVNADTFQSGHSF